MSSLSRKRVFCENVSLQHAKKRRDDKTIIDYTMCIICQGRTNKGLLNVQITTPKLIVAMTARQDDTFRRLRNDSAVEMWVENKSPIWHAKCRNIYI